MPYKIELDDSEIPAMVEFFSMRYEANKSVIQRATEENIIILKRLEALNGLSTKNVPSLPNTELTNNTIIDNPILPNGYSEKMIWLDKVRYILKQAGHGLTTTEIIDALLKIEPKYKLDRKTAMRSVSATVSSKSKEGGVITKAKNERNEFVYSLKDEDSDDNGEIF